MKLLHLLCIDFLVLVGGAIGIAIGHLIPGLEKWWGWTGLAGMFVAVLFFTDTLYRKFHLLSPPPRCIQCNTPAEYVLEEGRENLLTYRCKHCGQLLQLRGTDEIDFLNEDGSVLLAMHLPFPKFLGRWRKK